MTPPTGVITATIILSDPDMNKFLGILYDSGDSTALRVWREIQRQRKAQQHEQRRAEQYHRETFTPAWAGGGV